MSSSLRLLSCSWPRPVRHDGHRWLSDPDWDAPQMPRLPAFAPRDCDGATLQSIDWRAFFGNTVNAGEWNRPGEMKGFHVVFRIRIECGGTLVFHDDDGCMIRRDGVVVHEDREIHPLQRHELTVRAGDVLEIAQWQFHGEWVWAGGVEPRQPSLDEDLALFEPFRADVERALRHPNGPPLKTYFAANNPLCAALAIYSAILNGYRPAGVQIYGDYQWDPTRRHAVQRLLPFAEIVPTQSVLAAAGALDPRLVPMARSMWTAMKLCVNLFHPPFEYCFLDDDVFILDRMDDALELFLTHDVVYQTDWDHGEHYRNVWRSPVSPLPTGNINTGICFIRNRHDRRAQAARIAGNSPNGHAGWLWEQGYIAVEFAGDPTAALPTQRYFYPIFDGLPGGLLDYDWALNPCGFATVHFGGLCRKPDDADIRVLAREILGRRRAIAS
jgi:hypothetical protein